MHGGEVDEGYCIMNSDAFEKSMAQGSPSRILEILEYFKEAEQVTELNNGYSFQFPANSESIEKLVKIITEERKNNLWIEFELIFQHNEGPLVLEIKGNTAKDFVKSYIPSSFLVRKWKVKKI